jgi:chemotaxis protein MotB
MFKQSVENYLNAPKAESENFHRLLQGCPNKGCPGRIQAPILVVRRRPKRPAIDRKETWKVAYADFVTALMALFSVLWVLSSSPLTKQAIGAYFDNGRKIDVRTTSEPPTPASDDREETAEKLRRAIQLNPELGRLKMQVEISVTTEGVRVDLLEKNRIPLFEAGRQAPTRAGTKLIIEIARELGKLPNRVAVEGHTDSRVYQSPKAYTNWELSIDRANAARRLMIQNGLRPDQVSEVRGSADQDPGLAKTAKASANRRVTLIVKSLHVAASPRS